MIWWNHLWKFNCNSWNTLAPFFTVRRKDEGKNGHQWIEIKLNANEAWTNHYNHPTTKGISYVQDEKKVCTCAHCIRMHTLLLRICTGKSFSEALILESVNHNMTRDCSLNSPKNTSSQHVVYKNCFLFLFWHSKQYLYTTWCELVFFGEFNEQSHIVG